MIQNYSKLVERISNASGLAVEEIERRVEAKRAKLSGLISREGAAQIVAAELGIALDKQKLKINELLPEMKKANVIGKIVQLFPVVEFKKDNREGKVANMIIADETGNIRTVLWDTNHIKLIEEQKIKQGDVIEISAASLRNMELHLTGFSDIKLSQEKLENVKTEKQFYEKKISDFKIGENINARAVIVQIFEPRFFEVCPECGKKAVNGADGSVCEKHGKVIPQRRAILSLVLDDGSGSVRAILFSEAIEKLGVKNLDNFFEERINLLGKEAFFSGNMRQNKLFNNPELAVNDIKDIEIEKLIEVLEKG